MQGKKNLITDEADNGSVLVIVIVTLSLLAYSLTLPLFYLVKTQYNACKTGRKNFISSSTLMKLPQRLDWKYMFDFF